MNARHAKLRPRPQCTRPAAPAAAPPARREAAAIVLLCLGLLTQLALASFDPRDGSLNATGAVRCRNWVGPAGAYWADAALSALGIGAHLLGLALLLAGVRAFVGRRLLPSLQEAGGGLLLVVAVGALAQLGWRGEPLPYPPGGLAGALLAGLLRRALALAGAWVAAVGLALVALSCVTDGILLGLGQRGLRLVAAVGDAARRLGAAALGARRRRAGGPTQLPGPKGRRPRRREGRPTLTPVPDLDAAAPVAAAAAPPVSVLPRLAAAVPDTEADADPGADAAAAGEYLAEGDAGQGDDAGAGARAAAAAPAERRPAAAEPQIVDVRPDLAPLPAALEGPVAAPPASAAAFVLPPVALLDYEAAVREPVDPARLRDNALRLTKTLKDYGIDGHVREIRPGPVVTMYEYVPGPGIKLSKIASLADDLAMSMEALRVRIVAPIPGKGAVGIEIPNEGRETVYLKEIIAHETFHAAPSRLTMALGKDIEGGAYVADLARMPHLLVAGATGAGKSVSINAMIMSVLFKATPDEVRMIMVDPKMLELSVYEGIPHLLLPVVTDPKKAALALRWAVEEMERRYELLSEVGVRSIDGYNARVRAAAARGAPITRRPAPGAADGAEAAVPLTPLPYLLVIVDELADLMMVASREVEASIMRLAQMARAAGIHLILATQRPSVDVLTGVIKANFPTRIAFQVASRHDSRTIIDGNGAEHLLGRGDMLYMSPGAGGLLRVHGAYVSDEEIDRAVRFVRDQGRPTYDESILQPRGDEGAEAEAEAAPRDEMYDQAVAIVAETRQASVSMIQRRLRIGYNRAARMVERMEHEGIVGPADGIKPREVLVRAM